MNTEKDLIRKYLQGECSEEEEKEALKLLVNDENDEWLEEIADEEWETASSTEPAAVNADLLYEKIEKEIHPKTYRRATRHPLRPWLYAACISFLAISVVWFLQHKTNIGSKPAQELVVKSMPAGMKSTILLSDGSKVILNSGSRITYAREFTDSSRVITLEGEAWFDVAKDKTRPFSVIANGTVTTALGTSFNINARGQVCKVSLATGKVVVTPAREVKKSKEENYILHPGQSLEVNTTTGMVSKATFNPDADLLWKDGILYFSEKSVEEIFETLELWYDVEFEIKGDEDMYQRYTGRFENASLSHVMESMGYALDFDYLIKGKKVIIYKEDK